MNKRLTVHFKRTVEVGKAQLTYNRYSTNSYVLE